jgi:hypothetical protein
MDRSNWFMLVRLFVYEYQELAGYYRSPENNTRLDITGFLLYKMAILFRL